MAQHKQEIPNGTDFRPLMERLFRLKEVGDATIADTVATVSDEMNFPPPEHNEMKRRIHVSIDEPLFQMLLQNGHKISNLKLVLVVRASDGLEVKSTLHENVGRRVVNGHHRKRLECDIARTVRPALERIFSDVGIETKGVRINNIVTKIKKDASRLISDQNFFGCSVLRVDVETNDRI